METIKKNQLEMKDTLTKMKNNLQGISSKGDEVENQISNLEYKEAKNTQLEQQEKNFFNENSVRNLLDNFKCTNIHIMGVPEEETEQEIENLFEKIMTENFPNLVKEIDMQVQEAQSPKQDEPKEVHTKIHN